MESPIGDRNMIDIKVEKYKEIVPDNYIDRHVISVYDTCTVTRWYDVGKVTALKIHMCSVVGGNEHSYGAMVRCLLASPLIMPTFSHGRVLWLTITCCHKCSCLLKNEFGHICDKKNNQLEHADRALIIFIIYDLA